MKRTDIAMNIHDTETQGDNLSPIRAAFQNIPKNLTSAKYFKKKRYIIQNIHVQKNILIQFLPSFVSVQDARHESMNVGAGTDNQQDNDEQRLKIENS